MKWITQNPLKAKDQTMFKCYKDHYGEIIFELQQYYTKYVKFGTLEPRLNKFPTKLVEKIDTTK